MMRPASSRDTKFFWDGVNAHELRIQKRGDGTLQHPPVPALWQDKEVPTDYVVASGKGTVFSFVVHHAPKVPGRTLPFVIALVELEEGVRMLGELRNVDPASVKIGLPVRAMYIDFPDGDSGPGMDQLRMGARRVSAPAIEVGTKLPELSLYGDPTFIVSTAIATRDYQDVHHDRDKAQAKGSKDIFVNILTDTGLVQRYITDWAGPNAVIKSIGLRLGVPWYAYDTVTFRGEVTAVDRRRDFAESDWQQQPWRPRDRHRDPHDRRRLMPGELSGKAAIVGIGATDFSKNSGRSELRLASEAVLDALDDAGLTPADVDGMVTFTMDSNTEVVDRTRHRNRGAEVLLQDPPRRRRGLRHGAAGGDRGGHGCRGLRCGIPGFQRAVGYAVRPGADAAWSRMRTPRAWTTRSRIRTACRHLPHRWR